MKSKNGILGTLIVRDSSALINPNTLVSITEVKPVNLSELEEKEKLELAFQYQYFIRSLTFPIQIVLRFVNKDCEKFLYRKRMADVEELIKKAYDQPEKLEMSDDASVAEFAGMSIELVPGHYENIKITTPEDLFFAEAMLKRKALDKP